MPYQDLPGLGMRGLNRDTPPQKLDHTEFSDGMNLRPFDGSLQQVFAFTKEESFTGVLQGTTGGVVEDRRVFATTQWTKSGENRANVAYLYTTSRENTQNLSLQVVEDILGSQVPVQGVMAATPTDDSTRFGIDLFAFNDVLIVNDGQNHPVWLSREIDSETDEFVYTAKLIPGWPSGSIQSVSTSQRLVVLGIGAAQNDLTAAYVTGEPNWTELLDQTNLFYSTATYGTEFASDWAEGVDYVIGDVVFDDGQYYRCRIAHTSTSVQPSGFNPGENDAWTDIFPRPIVGTVFEPRANIAEADYTPNDSDGNPWLGTPVLAQRMIAFNNRLVALNISEEYLGSESYGNASMLWSTNIAGLGTLDGLTFQVQSNNSAGDDILTETVGEIYDAIALGQYLIVYKSDGAYRFTDTGDPLFLVGEPFLTDDGLFSPGCAVDIGGGRHFVVGSFGVYLHDGGPNKKNISRGRVERYFYSRVNPGAKDNTFVFHHKAEKEVWICYPHVQSWSPTQSYVSGQDLVYREIDNNGTFEGRYYVAWQPVLNYFGVDNYPLWQSSVQYTDGQYISYVDPNGTTHYLRWGEEDPSVAGEVPVTLDSDGDPVVTDGWDELLISFDNVGKDPDTTGIQPVDLVTFADYQNLSAYNANPPVERGGQTDAYWLEIEGTGCNQAMVYNYEHDTWYERRVPMFFQFPTPVLDAADYMSPSNDDFRGDALSGMTGVEVNGTLVIIGQSQNGFYNLRNERENQVLDDPTLSDYGNIFPETLTQRQDRNTGTNNRTGFAEFHYLGFGDHSKVKHLHALYPHTTGMVTVDVDTTNNLGVSGEPNFLSDDRVFNALDANDYKLDYRIHGRYYHFKIESHTADVFEDGSYVYDEILNPEITGMGMDLKLGGDR